MLQELAPLPSTAEAIADAFFSKHQIHIALERAWAEAQVKPRKSCPVRCQPDQPQCTIEPFAPTRERWINPESVRCQRCLRLALWERGQRIAADRYEEDIEAEVPGPEITRAWLDLQGWHFGGIKYMRFWSYTVRASEILMLRETSVVPPIERITRKRRRLVPWNAPLEEIEEALFCRSESTIEFAAMKAWSLMWNRYRPYDPARERDQTYAEPSFLQPPPTPEHIDLRRRRDAHGETKRPWAYCTQEEARLMLLWAHTRGINWFDLGWLDVGRAVEFWIEDARLRMYLRANCPTSVPVASQPRRGL